MKILPRRHGEHKAFVFFPLCAFAPLREKKYFQVKLFCSLALFFASLFLSPLPSFSEEGDTRESLLARYGEPHLQEKYDHLTDMLFWGQLDPRGKTYEFWGYDGVVNADGYGTPGRTIVFDGERITVFMILCGPQVYRCQWPLRETLPPDLRQTRPTVIPEAELRKKGWANERAKAIYIWRSDRYYVEAVVAEEDPKDWLNAKIIGSVKALPELLGAPKPGENR